MDTLLQMLVGLAGSSPIGLALFLVWREAQRDKRELRRELLHLDKRLADMESKDMDLLFARISGQIDLLRKDIKYLRGDLNSVKQNIKNA
jgi:hypothetical protein